MCSVFDTVLDMIISPVTSTHLYTTIDNTHWAMATRSNTPNITPESSLVPRPGYEAKLRYGLTIDNTNTVDTKRFIEHHTWEMRSPVATCAKVLYCICLARRLVFQNTELVRGMHIRCRHAWNKYFRGQALSETRDEKVSKGRHVFWGSIEVIREC